MYNIIKKLGVHKVNIKGLKHLDKDTKEKLIILLFIILVVTVIVFLVIRLLNFAKYEAVDHSKKVIFFGQTCDLENNAVSKSYAIGYQLALDYINQQGGIDGYHLKIILLNDKYETDLAVKNAKLLIDYYNVLAIIGSFGTPTSLGIINDAINGRPVPLIGPYTSSPVYRKYFNKYLILMNTDFRPEFELMVENLLANKYYNLSIIYQNDIYGMYFYNSFVDYNLEHQYPFTIVSSGKYERNSNDLDGCFKSVFGVQNAYDYQEYTNEVTSKMQAVVIFAAEKEIASIIGQLKKMKPSVAIYYNFFVGTSPGNLKFVKYENKDNIYQTLLSHENIDDYPELNGILNKEIAKYNSENLIKIDSINVSLSLGFISGMMIGKVLEQFKGDMTKINRETFTDMFYEMKNIEVYGFPIGPFIMGQNNEGIRYAEINQLQPDMSFKELKKKTIGDYQERP